jgi:hypothetical protein
MDYTQETYIDETLTEVNSFAQYNTWGLDARLEPDGSMGDFIITVTLGNPNGPTVAEFTDRDPFIDWVCALDSVPDAKMAEYLHRQIKN